ncbi:MAG: nuclear transport factor 2 family protein [Bryobacteraceae bacterium]
MTLQFIGFCLAVCAAPAMLVAQDAKVNLKADEAAIRAVIASGKTPYTDDSVFWTGAYKRPAVGKETPEPFPETKAVKRKNQVNTTKVERLEIAASGDLAWEFSYVHTEYDSDETPTSHKTFDAGMLRVWKKVNGEWKAAAVFGRPLDVPFVAH